MFEHEATILYRPDSPELAFLPEGPQHYQENQVSWVAIQHSGDAKTGSICILDLKSGENRRIDLPGRPGFAFPTSDPDVFTVGAELTIGRYNITSGEWVLRAQVEGAEGTVINDGEPHGESVIFGTKDLEFKTPKAALFHWHPEQGAPRELEGGQICSNGKVVIERDGQEYLLDIDSPTKTVVEYPLNNDGPSLGEKRVVVDLTKGEAFPDGMVLTPDGASIIIAFYNPNDVPWGEARQYSLADGALEGVWKCPGSPRVTCPQLIEVDGTTKLFLTTAVEHMTDEEKAKHPNAGCLYLADLG